MSAEDRRAARIQRRKENELRRKELLSGNKSSNNNNNVDSNNNTGARRPSQMSAQEQKLLARKQMNEGTESLQRSLARAKDAHEIGADTMIKLQEQHEQIDRVDKKLDETDQTLKSTKFTLESIKSWGGMIKNAFRKKPAPAAESPKVHENEANFDNRKAKFNNNERKIADRNDNFNNVQKQQQQQQQQQARNQLLGNKSNDKEITDDDLMKEWESVKAQQDDQLDELSGLLKGMEHMGREMGSELDTQSKMLENTSSKIDRTDAEIQRQNRTIRKIMG